jgi:hypothetical protein
VAELVAVPLDNGGVIMVEMDQIPASVVRRDGRDKSSARHRRP